MLQNRMPWIPFALLTLLVLAACGSNPGPTDTDPPTVISVFPQDGYHGFKRGQAITIGFSEPMDAAATEGAFQLLDSAGAPVAVSFSWEDEGRRLVAAPVDPVAYSADASYTNYRLLLSTGAKDKAGNPLAQGLDVTFSTLRRVTATLTSEAIDGMVFSGSSHLTYDDLDHIWVGDRDTNRCVYGYFSFALTGLPEDLEEVYDARFFAYATGVEGTPYNDLGGWLLLDHVDYGDSLDGSDFDLAPLSDPDNNPETLQASDGWSTGWFVVGNLQRWLQGDLDAGRNRIQLRYRFADCTDGDGSHDTLHLTSAESSSNQPYLEVDYLVP